jgi:heme/copper-type cytochrome/quinol oxidase subunit 4
MLISCTTLCNVMNNYKKQNNEKKEGYDSLENINTFNDYLLSFILAIIFFVLEFLLLFYAIYIALTCSQTGPEKIVHLLLALTFTIPYLLFMIALNPCATNTLRGLSSNTK